MIEKGEFTKGLFRSQSVVEKKGTMPILPNVLIETKDNGICITATDLEIGIKGQYQGEIKKPGNITLSANKLYEVVKELPEKDVSFRMKENQWVEIKSGKSVFTIMGASAETFPSFPAYEEEEFMALEKSVLREMIDKTIFAFSTDESRYNLTGVFFTKHKEEEDQKMRMVATDSTHAWWALRSSGCGPCRAMLPLAVVGSWRHRYDPRFRLLIASAALTFIGFLFVPVSQGHGWGFRYFHPAWFVLPLLAAAAVAAASESACARLDERSGQALGRFVQGAALVGLVMLTPFFAWRVHGFIAGHLEQLPIARHGEPRLVIVNPYTGYYAPDLVQNDPFLRDPVIRMITHGRRNDEAMLAQHFPDLELLARSYRGSVWGYPETSAGKSAGVAVGGNQHAGMIGERSLSARRYSTRHHDLWPARQHPPRMQ